MADAKKDAPHAPDGYQNFADVFFWLLLVLVVISLLGGFFNTINLNLSIPDLSSISAFVLNQLQVFSIFLSLLFFVGILYFNFQTGALHSHHSDHAHVESIHTPHPPAEPDKRWQKIMEKLSSPSESDWRFAIIEADIILEEMLSRMGYFGEGIAEKLKTVESSDFKTLDKAWAAHKVRNQIAHAGSNFKLSKTEAERTIDLFKQVFEEFYFI